MQIKYLTKKAFIINDGNEKSFTTGGIISESGTILIGGCDDRLTPETICALGLPPVISALCCDYRRSSIAGILNFETAAKYIGENCVDLLARPERWWGAPENRWHLYNVRSDGDILPVGAANVNKISADEKITIGGVEITALSTPGDTDYSMSYLIEDDGVKIVFCGGLLYKGGKIPYLYRLTQNIPDQGHFDYHGYLRGIPVWKNSLDTISAADIAVPYIGGVIGNLKSDIDTFKKNIDEYFGYYADISSLNYFFEGLAESPEFTRGEEKDFPPYVKNIGDQCNVIFSESGHAIAVDCGGEGAVGKLLEMLERGEIKSVDALYITHYHDDHVDGCEYFGRHFDCPVYADKIQADILQNPMRYRLPCISPVSAGVSPLDDGHVWNWHEFELTSFAFPGQSLYHGGLMLKSGGETVFFAGDSFTPAGIDDYCAYNRNLMIPGEGYFKCLDILKKHMPDYIINQHVARAFAFSAEQLDYMEQNLRDRLRVLAELSVWHDVNYALDEHFVMAYPYEQPYIEGEGADVKILISDYSDKVKCDIVPPKHQSEKNIYGIRVYIGDIYIGQKSCFIVN